MITSENTIVLGAGSVEYALAEAAVDIDEMIAALEQAKNDGATHVVASSGNYRGAQWARLSTDYGWASEGE